MRSDDMTEDHEAAVISRAARRADVRGVWGKPGFIHMGNDTRMRREMAYSRCRREVRGPIAAILDMIVGETVGYTVVAQRYGMHNRRAKRLLIDALDLWPQIFGTVCKDVDAATLIAAHAGILS